MKIFFFVVAVLSLPLPTRAQTPDTGRADSLRAAGELDAAVDAYRTALRDAQTSGRETGPILYVLATTHALAGQAPDSAFAYLDLALAFDSTVDALYDPDLYFLVDDPRWARVEDDRLDLLAARLGDAFERSYARDLLAARMHEWAYRYHIMLAFRTLGPGSPVLTALAHAMQEHHGQNQTRILALIDSAGWPRRSAVGAEAAFAAANVLTHADLATRQRYLPLLLDACDRDEADWSDCAPVLDRTELELGRRQIYGTQMEMNEETGVYEPQPMVDPERVDERRAARGMEPIADQLERFNAAMRRDFGQ